MPRYKSELLLTAAAFGLVFHAAQAPAADGFTPTSTFTDNNDGTVYHQLTGLTWKRCAEGQTWSTSTCSGTATTYTFDTAQLLTANFAGKTDWRLPSTWELATIVDYDNHFPAVNSAVFPNTPTSTFFWSGIPFAGHAAYAWFVDFNGGSVGHAERDKSAFVRLVRGGRPLRNLSTPSADFTDNGDGTVYHKLTGLTWKRCTEGQNWTGSACRGLGSFNTYDQASALTSNFAGKNDWRLPNIQELLSIVETGATKPTINTAIFPNTSNSLHWSASPHWYPNYVYFVEFYDGHSTGADRLGPYLVRLVRGTQSPAFSLAAGSAECLFNWAERQYGGFFSPSGAASDSNGEYDYRYYSGTKAYLATKADDQHLYYLGPATGNNLTDLGALSGWLARAGCLGIGK